MAIIINSCPMCGANVKENSRSCLYCGSDLIFTSLDVAELKVDNKIIEENSNKWKDALSKSPEDARANFNMGIVYLNKGLRDAAINCFRKAVNSEPDFTLAHFNLAIALFNDEQSILVTDQIELEKEIELAILLDPTFTEAVAFKYYFNANKFSNIDFQKSLELYNNAIKCNDNISAFYNGLGFLYLNSKDFSNAILNFQKALDMGKIQGKPTLKFYNNIMCCYAESDRSTALNYGEKLDVEIQNSTIKGSNEIKGTFYENLAIYCLDFQSWDEAIKYIKIALTYNKTSPSIRKLAGKIYNNYGVVVFWEKQKMKNEAISNIDIALQYDPTNLSYLKNKTNIKNHKKGCFIATATMGDYNHPVVMDLRQFRDNWLLRRKWGVAFTNWYYKYGPKAAKVIENSVVLKKITYLLLIKPLQLITKKLK